MVLLKVNDINTYFEKSHILHDVSLEIHGGEIVALLGRNGAGKTTTLRSIMGHTTPRSGKISFRGEDITGLEPHTISKRGISLIPERRRLFDNRTVRENLRLGYLGHGKSDEVVKSVFRYFPRLEERVDQEAGTLSGGEQQMLAIGRSLVSDPDLMLVDEPTEGLMPSLVDTVRSVLTKINEDGVSILLVEQNAELALDLSDRGYVIENGVSKLEGDSESLKDDEEIKRRYLAV
jgi:branched-chain amino acid transport system ATP-binding protein